MQSPLSKGGPAVSPLGACRFKAIKVTGGALMLTTGLPLGKGGLCPLSLHSSYRNLCYLRILNALIIGMLLSKEHDILPLKRYLCEIQLHMRKQDT